LLPGIPHYTESLLDIIFFIVSFLAGARKEVLRKADEQSALAKHSKAKAELWVS
jgi:hypothetical protein